MEEDRQVPSPPGLTNRHFLSDRKRRTLMSLRRRDLTTPFGSQPMSALSLLRDWRRQVQDELLPGLHGHQSKALADMSFAMTIADHCWAGKLAVAVPGDARPAHVKRRIERTLANDRIDPDSVWPELAGAILDGRPGGPVVLILDETPNRNALRCMKIPQA